MSQGGRKPRFGAQNMQQCPESKQRGEEKCKWRSC